jgi:ATP-binding cassette, subfamily B (MDR/TAP), member 1
MKKQLSVKHKAGEEEEKETRVSMRRIMSYYHPKWMAAFAIFISVLNSVASPLFGFLFAKILFVMMIPQSPNFEEDRDFYCGMFLLLAFCVGITGFLQKYCFQYVGEGLTFDVRMQLFKGIIYKSIQWFDHKDRAPGILGNVLSEDITALNGMTTEHIAVLIEASLGLVVGIIISLAYSWKMGLITLSMVPFVQISGILMANLQLRAKASKGKKKEDDPYNKSNALLADIIINYRTVIGFGEKNVNFLLDNYNKLLEEPNRHAIKKAHIQGLLFGYSQCIRFIFIGVVFYIAAVLIFKNGENSVDTYICVNTLFVAALGSGMALSAAPSVNKAREAANKIFSIIDEPSEIDTRDEKGIKVIKKGSIDLVKTEFKYPSRTVNVLNQMDMKIPATKKIALVGHSGCGKSTIANLLLRLYDITGGKLLIDGIDIRDYNVRELRKQIGIVMQEPVLFDMTIKENILYGNEHADDAKVRQVAQLANALQFIESNIEDLEKDDVQKEVVNKFISAINNASIVNKNIIQLGKLYSENSTSSDQNFTIDQVKLVEEVLSQADGILLSNINQNVQAFIKVVKEKSLVKGCRWDDIVFRFEYET